MSLFHLGPYAEDLTHYAGVPVDPPLCIPPDVVVVDHTDMQAEYE